MLSAFYDILRLKDQAIGDPYLIRLKLGEHETQDNTKLGF